MSQSCIVKNVSNSEVLLYSFIYLVNEIMEKGSRIGITFFMKSTVGLTFLGLFVSDVGSIKK